jgi:hypothetical protein
VAGFKFDEPSVRRIAKSVIESERRLNNPSTLLPSATDVNQTWWPYRNDYAGEVPSHGVLAITGITLATGRLPVYTADRPSTTFRTKYAVSYGRPVPQGGMGQCCFTGPCTIAHDASWSPAAGERGGPKPSSFLLFKDYPAISQVAGVVDATADWLTGSLYEITSLMCQSQADNAAGSLATNTSDYKIMKGTAGSEADAGYTTQPAIYAREAISDNVFFSAEFINGAWYAIQGGGAKLYKCLLSATLANGDATASIDTVTALDGGSGPSPTSAANYLGWAGANNDPALILETTSGVFLLLSVKWSVITPVTNVDTSGTALRQTKQDHIGKSNAAAGSPSTIDAGTTC